ncbi:hypothetical protein UB45_18255 [Terrabacter sp. 28]|nr:hypothetical protein UB45_18255 [Terrabacter sp. 28]
MSVLVHLCRGCDHQQAWHEGGNGGYTPCRCCRAGTADPDPAPTLLPTAGSPDGIREGLWPPGALRNAGTMHAARTCACSACEATFRELGAATRGAPGVQARDPRSEPDRAAG